MATISVIVPNYNHAPFLPERIESILNQTQNDFELLILDDHSPDDSRAVIARYAADPRVRFAFNDANSGSTFRQWQKGLALTTGDYVWIAESDDFADPSLLERLAGEMDRNPKVAIAFCQTTVVDRDSRQQRAYLDGWRVGGTPTYDFGQFERDFTMDGRDFLRRFMIPWNSIPNASAVLFRRSALEAAGGPELGMRLCGDWLTYCRVMLHGDVAHVADRLNFFRDHGVNVRSGSKGDLLVRESMAVDRWAEGALGRLPAGVRRTQRRFYARMLAAHDRPAEGGAVPLARAPAALARAARLSPALVPATLALLAREQAGVVKRALGLKRG